ncbi:hypothetical protein [Paenibacillus sp. MMO-58]|uniref:hypothetical protein n=1 Tax=Paenibacillus sp. MMO-58 TaxID=3081290 RepID=UPI0030180C38
MKAEALSACTVALFTHGATTIMETQQEFEGENGTTSAVTPAKSIWLNTAAAKKLRDFLNEKYPIE